MARSIRVVVATAWAAALLTTGVLAASAGPAGATPPPLCTLLPSLCPTTTAAPPAPTTTVAPAPATTVAPITTATTKAAVKPTPTTVKATAAAAAGTLALGVGAPDAASLSQALPAAADPSAPELAVNGTPADNQTTRSGVQGGLPVSALGVPATAGLPDHHTTLRILLSFVAVAIAGLAARQLPASRRRPKREPALDGLDVIDGL